MIRFLFYLILCFIVLILFAIKAMRKKALYKIFIVFSMLLLVLCEIYFLLKGDIIGTGATILAALVELIVVSFSGMI